MSNKTIKIAMPCGEIEVACKQVDDLNNFSAYNKSKYGYEYKVLYSMGLCDIVYHIGTKKFFKGYGITNLKEISRDEVDINALRVYNI